MMKGRARVMGKQISYMTLIGVHSTMHLVHPNYCCVCVSMSMDVCMHEVIQFGPGAHTNIII